MHSELKFLGLHNTLREKHYAPELIEDPNLSDQGQTEEIFQERFFGENAIITGNNNAS